MRWTPGGTSDDIEDRRDEGGPSFGGFGGFHLGIGGTLLLIVLSLVFRTNLFNLFSGAGGDSQQRAPVADSRTAPANDREVQFISFVLDDVQHTWEKLLPSAGERYHHTKLVLFRDLTNSGCGTAQAATGPFYCPSDEKVYIDLGFYDELRDRFGAPGEFAQAYVLAHEIGHHVQNLLHLTRQPSVSLELQADCLAGVWANSTEQRKLIDDADVNAGLRAAAAVGDDRLQRMAGRQVSPETWTHGSSAHRMAAFRRGLDSGTLAGCGAVPR